MAKITRWTLFWRAFFLSLLLGQSTSAQDRAETDVWNRAVTANSPEGYYLYLSLYPAGSFVDEAVSALAGLDALDTRGVTSEMVNQGRNQGGGRGFQGQSDTSDTTGGGSATNQGRQESQRQSDPGMY